MAKKTNTYGLTKKGLALFAAMVANKGGEEE